MPQPFSAPHAGAGRLITIGASLGGVSALQRLARGLPADLAAPVVAVQHIGAYPSRLPEVLSASGPLRASHVVDGEPLRPGHLHVAPPDHHVVIEGGVLRLTRGPKEHHTRPSLDPLFRSAALSHGPNVVGVVLTGGLDDGTAGLQAIKDAGGIAIVQEPAEAEDPSMPLSALHYVNVDHRLRLDEMAALLARLVGQVARPGEAPPAMDNWQHEHDVTIHKGDPMEHLSAIAAPSTFVCPDCRGSLWQVAAARPARFICHTGHAYTLRSLQHVQTQATDDALWTAIRALQEKRVLLQAGVDSLEAEGEGLGSGATDLRAQIRVIEQQEVLLRALLEVLPPTPGG